MKKFILMSAIVVCASTGPVFAQQRISDAQADALKKQAQQEFGDIASDSSDSDNSDNAKQSDAKIDYKLVYLSCLKKHGGDTAANRKACKPQGVDPSGKAPVEITGNDCQGDSCPKEIKGNDCQGANCPTEIGDGSGNSTGSSKKMSDADAAALKQQANDMTSGMMGAFSAPSATQGALDRSNNAPPVLIDPNANN